MYLGRLRIFKLAGIYYRCLGLSRSVLVISCCQFLLKQILIPYKPGIKGSSSLIKTWYIQESTNWTTHFADASFIDFSGVDINYYFHFFDYRGTEWSISSAHRPGICGLLIRRRQSDRWLGQRRNTNCRTRYKFLGKTWWELTHISTNR